MEPLQTKLPQEPEKLKALLDERLALRDTHVAARDEATKAIQAVDAEIKLIQQEVEFVFQIKEKPAEPEVPRDPQTGEKLSDKKEEKSK